MAPKLKLTLLPDRFAALLPAWPTPTRTVWAQSGAFHSADYTRQELSLIVEESAVSAAFKSQRGLRIFSAAITSPNIGFVYARCGEEHSQSIHAGIAILARESARHGLPV